MKAWLGRLPARLALHFAHERAGRDVNGRAYLVALLAAGWAILAIASARGGKWPIMGLCLLMMSVNLLQLYRLTRK